MFEQLSALLPQSAYPKFDLAVLLVETKQDEAALKVLEPLLATDPSDPESLSLASEAYEAVGNTPKAVSLLRQAIVLSPETADYYNAFVLLCLDHESFQVGIDMLNAGLQRIRDDPSLYISRGLLYAQLADYEKAEADFSTAEHIDSRQSLSAYATDILEVQRAMSDKSHPDKAILEIRSQLKAHPDGALLHLLLAKLLVYQESDMEAKSSREAIRSADSREAETRLGGGARFTCEHLHTFWPVQPRHCPMPASARLFPLRSDRYLPSHHCFEALRTGCAARRNSSAREAPFRVTGGLPSAAN